MDLGAPARLAKRDVWHSLNLSWGHPPLDSAIRGVLWSRTTRTSQLTKSQSMRLQSWQLSVSLRRDIF